MTKPTETAAKIDVVVAGGIAIGGASGMTMHDVLQTGQLALSIAATALGSAYLLWKWAREWRTSRRRDRRQTDRQ